MSFGEVSFMIRTRLKTPVRSACPVTNGDMYAYGIQALCTLHVVRHDLSGTLLSYLVVISGANIDVALPNSPICGRPAR